MHYRAALIALAWPLLACDPPERSDEDQYELNIGLVDQLGVDSRRVLVGSEFEFSLSSVVDGDEELAAAARSCVDSSASGSLTEVDANHFAVEAAGPGAIELTAPADACPDEQALAELGPDRWSMIGVEASAATGTWIAPGDSAALYYRTSPGPAGAFPEALGRPLDEGRVVADANFELRPALVEAGVGEHAEVRWHDPEALLVVPAHYEALATYVDHSGETQHQRWLYGSLRAGESFDSSLVVLGHDFALPPVRAVPSEAVASLELVGLYLTSEQPEREWGPPAGVVAIAHDSSGRRVVGGPIEWSVTRGRLIREDPGGSADLILVGDCKATPRRPQWRSATVEATLGDLVAAVDLEWVALPGDATDPTAAECTGSACDCSTAARPRDSALALFALLGLGAWLRRRPKADGPAQSK